MMKTGRLGRQKSPKLVIFLFVLSNRPAVNKGDGHTLAMVLCGALSIQPQAAKPKDAEGACIHIIKGVHTDTSSSLNPSLH